MKTSSDPPDFQGRNPAISLVSQLGKVSERVNTWLLEQEVRLRDNHFGC